MFSKKIFLAAALLALTVTSAYSSAQTYSYQVFSPGLRAPLEVAIAPTSYLTLTSGNSYAIPAGVTTVEAWLIGAGGGGAGAGAIANNSAGGAGAAGALLTYSFPVQSGQSIEFAIGAPGVGATGRWNGNPGGSTSLTYKEISMIAYGGSGGNHYSRTMSLGGVCAGPGVCTRGGTGGGSLGADTGAGGGGVGGLDGIGGNSTNGAPGRPAVLPAGLQAALAALGIPLGTPGSGYMGTGPNGSSNGQSATGIGNGGGGAGTSGGNGGHGSFGGGGGGTDGYLAQTGGNGGAGIIILKLN